MIKNKLFILLASLFLLWSCTKEVAVPVEVDFSISVLDNDYSVPVRVAISNTTKGADDYLWTFEGGTPNSSTSKNPGTIVYNQAGDYVIKLEAVNRDDSEDSKEITLHLYTEIQINFETEIIENNYPPMEVNFSNTSTGAESYQWTFEGGIPSTSTEQNPSNVVFNEPGEHQVTLEVSNGLDTFQTQQIVEVAPHLEANFDYEVNFEDEDLQVPVTLTMINNSVSATEYNWSFIGAETVNSTEENPTITYINTGTFTLELEATNGKETETFTKEITLLPNTNIRTFNNIQLGINTAHNNNVIGAFFSTITREVYTANQVTDENGAHIDIAFFGLNQNFNYNKFISPNEVQNTTFTAIPNATHTKFINILENCDCTATMTVEEFDAIADDTLLSTITIEETTAGSQEFDNTLVPRIVLFETEDNRKGAIKITDFVEDGQNSYLVVDIKVMKEEE